MKHIGLAKLWHNKKTAGYIICLLLFTMFGLCGCIVKETAKGASAIVSDTQSPVIESTALSESTEENETQTESLSGFRDTQISTTEDVRVKAELKIRIDGQEVSVAWEDNESVAALRELATKAPITIQMSMYGGFEQVGSIGVSLPRNDVQTTTEAGDIVLYSGNQIVMFYGSNSWAYTRLGHITSQNAEGMAALLGNGNVTVAISMEKI
jgi:hypothetical protein